MIDVAALFSQILSSFWWVLPLFVLVALLKSPWFKGAIGEVMVNLAARLFLIQPLCAEAHRMIITTGSRHFILS